MAIPNRTTITCPLCGMAEDVVIADSSVGPRGRVSDTPIYTMTLKALWSQTKREGQTYLTCASCGAAEFITLAEQAKTPQAAPQPKGERFGQ